MFGLDRGLPEHPPHKNYYDSDDTVQFKHIQSI